jgi:hypothetical protein
MNTWRLPYTSALAANDPDRIVEHFAEHIVIHVAVHDTPMHGEPIARFLFGVLADELGPLRPTREIVEQRHAVVSFETTIADRAAQGLNVLDIDADGRIRELTVFFRPLDALAAIADAVGARMQARFGPPPR